MRAFSQKLFLTFAALPFAGITLPANIAMAQEMQPSQQAVQTSEISNQGAQGLAPMIEPAPAQIAGPLANFGPSSGTAVANRAIELRDEIIRLQFGVNTIADEFQVLRGASAANAVQYHSITSAITARLQNGTTRGNPILLRQWDEAQQKLSDVSAGQSRINELAQAISQNASTASFLLENVRAAFQLSGAVDEDHVQLAMLRDEVSRQIVIIDRLRNDIGEDVQRQNNFVNTERNALQTLAFAINRGEMIGSNFSDRPIAVEAAPVAALPASSLGAGAAFAEDQPQMLSPAAIQQGAADSNLTSRPAVGEAPSAGRLLALVRFNQPVVDYEQQLFNAVDTALDRRPAARFTLVAVSPQSGDPADTATTAEAAQRHVESVKASLLQMGLPADRIAVTTNRSSAARSAEVHVYVR